MSIKDTAIYQELQKMEALITQAIQEERAGENRLKYLNNMMRRRNDIREKMDYLRQLEEEES